MAFSCSGIRPAVYFQNHQAANIQTAILLVFRDGHIRRSFVITSMAVPGVFDAERSMMLIYI